VYDFTLSFLGLQGMRRERAGCHLLAERKNFLNQVCFYEEKDKVIIDLHKEQPL
jgi:hypothetical protein